MWREEKRFSSLLSEREKEQKHSQREFPECFSLSIFVCDLPIHLQFAKRSWFIELHTQCCRCSAKRAAKWFEWFHRNTTKGETSNTKFILRRCRIFLYLFIYFIIILYNFFLCSLFFFRWYIRNIIVIFISCSFPFILLLSLPHSQFQIKIYRYLIIFFSYTMSWIYSLFFLHEFSSRSVNDLQRPGGEMIE